jgi:hypothetical protein
MARADADRRGVRERRHVGGAQRADLLTGRHSRRNVIEQLRDAFEDRDVRAVVLRIESGGVSRLPRISCIARPCA